MLVLMYRASLYKKNCSNFYLSFTKNCSKSNNICDGNFIKSSPSDTKTTEKKIKNCKRQIIC